MDSNFKTAMKRGFHFLCKFIILIMLLWGGLTCFPCIGYAGDSPCQHPVWRQRWDTVFFEYNAKTETCLKKKFPIWKKNKNKFGDLFCDLKNKQISKELILLEFKDPKKTGGFAWRVCSKSKNFLHLSTSIKGKTGLLRAIIKDDKGDDQSVVVWDRPLESKNSKKKIGGKIVKVAIGSSFFVYNKFIGSKGSFFLLGKLSILNKQKETAGENLIGWVKAENVLIREYNYALQFRYKTIAGEKKIIPGSFIYGSPDDAFQGIESDNSAAIIAFPPGNPIPHDQMRYPVFQTDSREGKELYRIGFPAYSQYVLNGPEFKKKAAVITYHDINNQLNLGSPVFLSLSQSNRIAKSKGLKLDAPFVSYLEGWVAQKNYQNDDQVVLMALVNKTFVHGIVGQLNYFVNKNATAKQVKRSWKRIKKEMIKHQLYGSGSFRGFLSGHSLAGILGGFKQEKVRNRNHCVFAVYKKRLESYLMNEKLRIRINWSPKMGCQKQGISKLGAQEIWFSNGKGQLKMAWIPIHDLP